jgi:hypothetical protein
MAEKIVSVLETYTTALGGDHWNRGDEGVAEHRYEYAAKDIVKESEINDLLAECKRLEAVVNSLRNCANCLHSYTAMMWYCRHGTENKVQAMENPVTADFVCDKWEAVE